MNRLLTTLLAGASALAFAGSALAEQQDKDPQRRDNQTQTQPNATQGKPEQQDARDSSTTGAGGTSGNQAAGQSNDPVMRNQTENQAEQAGADEGNMGRKPNQPGGTVSAEEQAYLTDLQECDSMSGSQKQTCVDAAKKRHGQM